MNKEREREGLIMNIDLLQSGNMTLPQTLGSTHFLKSYEYPNLQIYDEFKMFAISSYMIKQTGTFKGNVFHF